MVEATWTQTPDGGTVVALVGRLGVRQVGNVQRVLDKLLADAPDRLVCDLTDLHYADPRCASVFVRAQRSPLAAGTLVVLAGASGQPARILRALGVHRILLHVATVEVALAVDPRSRPRQRQTVSFPPDLAAVPRARRFVDEVCGQWGLAELRDDVRLIASELVTNAIRHAGTMVELRLESTPELVVVAVADSSPSEPARLEPDPEAAGGRGLRLVEGFSDAWGANPRPSGGKVVWASLRTRPRLRRP
jgi:anti-anti-sigma factor